MLTPCVIISGILILCWLAVKDLAGIIVFAIFFGFFSGTFVSLPPASIASLTDDMTKVGSRMGLSFLVVSFAVLCGTPIDGAILDSRGGDFTYGVVFAGVVCFTGGIILTASRIAKSGWKLKVKV